MPKYNIKGVPVTVNAAGMILIDPKRLAEVLDEGVNPFELTVAERESVENDRASGLTTFPHLFANRMKELNG